MEFACKAIQFLRDLGRADLAALLRFSTYRLVETEVWSDISVPAVEITSPHLYTEALSGLPEWDQKRIAEAITATIDAGGARGRSADRVLLRTAGDGAVPEADSLYPEILIHRNQMIAVATRQTRIQVVNDYYRARHRRIAASLRALGVDNPNPHENLWEWYQKWKADLPSYADRRRYVNGMYQPLLEHLTSGPPPPVPAREPTGWERVDRALEKAHARFAGARHEEDYQTMDFSAGRSSFRLDNPCLTGTSIRRRME